MCRTEESMDFPTSFTREGSKVVFIRVQEDDAKEMAQVIKPENAGNLATFHGRAEVKEAEQLAWIQKMNRGESDRVYLIRRKSDGELLGAIGFHEIDRANKNARLGIFIFKPEDRGQGYFGESVRLFHGLAFLVLGMHKIYIRVLVSNDAGYHKYEALGYKHEGTLREEYFLAGTFRDMHVISLLASEYMTPVQ